MSGLGPDSDDAARRLLAAARARGLMIVTAESCTGGLVSAALTAIPGSSDAFDRGFVTYSYPAKTGMLGVPPEMLAAHGAVSEPVARAMAAGALHASGAGLAVAVTGVAGPGGSEAKPEGLVWFATAVAAEPGTARPSTPNTVPSAPLAAASSARAASRPPSRLRSAPSPRSRGCSVSLRDRCTGSSVMAGGPAVNRLGALMPFGAAVPERAQRVLRTPAAL